MTDIAKYIKDNGVCLFEHEAKCIYDTINSVENSNLLIFGVGNDSRLWIGTNDGETLFIEDDLEWSNKIREENPSINLVQFEYPRRIKEWRSLLDDESQLDIPIPEEVSSKKWDIIFVDGPLGNYNPKKTYLEGKEPCGRMYSLYMASKLVKSGGYVLVHDCCRDIEIAYSDKFLKNENLVEELKGGYRAGKGVLRKYKMEN
jgi:glucuronoxylan 4-O-methyltransferase